MYRIIVSPDSFKGSLTAREAAEIISEAACSASPDVETVLIPIADGGEGTVEALGAKRIACTVSDAHFQPIHSFWGDMGDVGVVELAACAGLPQSRILDPEITTTLGVGELIRSALDAGKKKIILALGGSSTNDLGCGMASALGVNFFDDTGKDFVPTGGTLKNIKHIDVSGLDERVLQCDFLTMCDVSNPLYGPQGAAHVYAPQKGADENAVLRLDEGLRHAASVIERDLGIKIGEIPGSGAAGGCGGGSIAFLNSTLKSGIDIVLDLKNFDDKLKHAALVITGEGKFDSQSFSGKAISGIAKRAKENKVPLVVLAGCAEESEACYDAGITAVFSIQRSALSLEEAKSVSASSLYRTTHNLIRLQLCK